MQLAIQPKNTKLGLIWNISLPAVETCGGMTEACAGPDGKCYVIKLYQRWPSVKLSHDKTYASILQSLEYGEELELPAKVKDGDTFRIHVAGDFFAPVYAYAWIKLITNNPNVNFYAYTRSWRMADMEDSLKELGNLPNMELLLSVDRDTGYPDKEKWAGFRTAFMMVNDNDMDLVEPDTHIVFRDNRHSVQKQVNGNLVCPVENGASKKHTTCQACKWCFRKEPNKSALGKQA
tara:strand:- start:1011 stop:1712 length:702 start_codon:yes stop_codon:yes gene_type:complete